jgi:ATP-dependent helicase Lhr and Lhr-like helicase
MTGF